MPSRRFCTSHRYEAHFDRRNPPRPTAADTEPRLISIPGPAPVGRVATARETTIKYARAIDNGVSETRALHHWHPVLLAEIDVHPRRARASKGKGERPPEERRSAAQRPLIPIIGILD